MSKFNTVRSDLTQDDIDDIVSSVDVAEDDYIIVVSGTGELKSVFMPEVETFSTPEKVQEVLALFGVSDAEFLKGNATLH